MTKTHFLDMGTALKKKTCPNQISWRFQIYLFFASFAVTFVFIFLSLQCLAPWLTQYYTAFYCPNPLYSEWCSHTNRAYSNHFIGEYFLYPNENLFYQQIRTILGICLTKKKKK